MAEVALNKNSTFSELGFSETIAALTDEIRLLYLADSIPWVVGYSGGKDSSAIVSLVWLALRELAPEQRRKSVHVISTDTLVENPIVASWVNTSLVRMEKAAQAEGLPIVPHRLTPDVADTFWVNLIGKGYPAPRNKFRWCTERLKIKPSNSFITRVVRENGEAILLLGTRKAESSRRSHNMTLHAKNAIRERLTPNASLPNSLVYTPIEDWSNDDVWLFLMRLPNPWGHSNKELMGMYRGASADGECPLVVDTSTPSCGNSRFGCWVCTLVDQDKSMAAMIQNDVEKDWMLPMLELRNELDFRSEEARARELERRDYRRMSGKLTMYVSQGEVQPVPGPYKAEAREYWLRRVLETQEFLRENAPKEMGEIELITPAELQEIRRIWVVEKHEIEDRVPAIYREVTGRPYPGPQIDDHQVFDNEVLGLLKGCCEGDPDGLHYEMLRNLIDVERRFRTMTRRRGLFEEIEKEIERCIWDGREDAVGFLREHEANRQGVADRLDDLDLRLLGGSRSAAESEREENG
jgi:DNA sulfur modification protein DndC